MVAADTRPVSPLSLHRANWTLHGMLGLVGPYVLQILALMWRWGYEPPQFDVDKAAGFRAAGSDIYLPASAQSERKAAT